MLVVTMSDPFSQVQGGSLLIDSSTIAPDEARQLASLSEHKAVEFIDAPVSGGVCLLGLAHCASILLGTIDIAKSI